MGTLVLSGVGYVPIEDVRAGDWVLAADPETGELRQREVLETFEVEEQPVLELVVVSGDGAYEDEIVVSYDHPFWVAGLGWVESAGLEVGDLLETAAGEPVVVASVQALGEVETVFNLTVEGDHTFFVGDAGVWVHNTDPLSAACAKLSGEAAEW